MRRAGLALLVLLLAAATAGTSAAAGRPTVSDLEDEVVCFMPEPSGFTVVEALALLRRIAAERPVAGIGVTGLGPAQENIAPVARFAVAAGL